jgi:hypothetical protein
LLLLLLPPLLGPLRQGCRCKYSCRHSPAAQALNYHNRWLKRRSLTKLPLLLLLQVAHCICSPRCAR